MKTSRLTLRTLLAAILLIAILAGCQSPTPTPAPTSAVQPTANLQPTLLAAQTQAVQTFAAKLTQSAPTATTPPTSTTAATATQAPTSTPPKPAGTATPTQRPQPSGPTATLPIYCTIKSFAPAADQTFSPNASFNLRWVVINTGSELWVKNTFEIMYWSGTRFVNQLKMSMPFDVGKGSDITIATGSMTAPSNPGTYRAVWAIVKGFTPYCLMPATVVVK